MKDTSSRGRRRRMIVHAYEQFNRSVFSVSIVRRMRLGWPCWVHQLVTVGLQVPCHQMHQSIQRDQYFDLGPRQTPTRALEATQIGQKSLQIAHIQLTPPSSHQLFSSFLRGEQYGRLPSSRQLWPCSFTRPIDSNWTI